jgi:hypothetical protein
VRIYLLLPFVGACFYFAPPASRSPLKEKLAPLSVGELEDATRKCLEKTGWKVDELPSQHGDIRVLHGKKGHDDASMYIYPEGMVPRLTGDLATGGDPLWPCLQSLPDGGADTPETDAGPPHDS